jgi:hypothetical protein
VIDFVAKEIIRRKNWRDMPVQQIPALKQIGQQIALFFLLIIFHIKKWPTAFQRFFATLQYLKFISIYIDFNQSALLQLQIINLAR